ncbi:hypothetical protein H920_13429 [Fukomys damarensis]|uniref:Uncharacterized protein n=1 Tax=Fukomys damarensis TaxID=885580 RepID=A0A091D430_FUKDA|nr:hypothetical protein H920_13429 [Fukomys damarensis]
MRKGPAASAALKELWSPPGTSSSAFQSRRFRLREQTIGFLIQTPRGPATSQAADERHTMDPGDSFRSLDLILVPVMLCYFCVKELK